MPIRSVLPLLAACALAACSPARSQPVPEAADLVLFNGKVVTVDTAFSLQRTVVVRGERIVAVGGDELRARFRGTREVDLRGRTLLPGFIDAHMHAGAADPRAVDLDGARSIAEVQARVRERARALGPGTWVLGGGFAEQDLAERRFPTRAELDAAAPENPVFVDRAGGHGRVANSRALRLAGVGRRTPDPAGGEIERDARGEPTGVLRERAAWVLVARVVPPLPEAEDRAGLVVFLAELPRMGITSFVEAANVSRRWTTFREIYREHGDSLPRAAIQFQIPERAEAVRAFLDRLEPRPGEGDARLRVGALKLIVDGGYSGGAAATLVPYRGRPEWFGILRTPPAELRAIVREAHGRGWQIGFHTIGDAAAKHTVDAVGEALREAPRAGHRHYLAHMSVLPPPATLRAMAEHGMLVVQQPSFVWINDGMYQMHLEGERLARANAMRTPLRHGVHLALSSDNLPLGPLVGIQAAVTRRGRRGTQFSPDEALTVPEAIRAYTKGAAYVTGEEGIKGSLEPGLLADMVVLSEDPLTVDPARISEARVEMTIIGGRVVFERGGAR